MDKKEVIIESLLKEANVTNLKNIAAALQSKMPQAIKQMDPKKLRRLALITGMGGAGAIGHEVGEASQQEKIDDLVEQQEMTDEALAQLFDYLNNAYYPGM